MNKSVSWIIWALAFFIINLGAFPIAAFSLFLTSEGTSIFSIDYMIALIILLSANIITVQIWLAIRMNNTKGFLAGVIVAILEISALFLFINSFEIKVCIALAVTSIVLAIGLLIWTIRSK